jgi:hypothetical protein
MADPAGSNSDVTAVYRDLPANQAPATAELSECPTCSYNPVVDQPNLPLPIPAPKPSRYRPVIRSR